MQSSILIVDNSIALTGALKAILNSCQFLKDRFSFHFVLPEGSTAALTVVEQGFTVDFLPFVEISKRPKDLALYFPVLCKNAFSLRQITNKYQVEVIHMNDFFNLVGIFHNLLGDKIPLVTHVRFMPHRFPKLLAKLWCNLNLKFADHIICVSEAVKSFFPSSDKVQVIYDPIPSIEKHSIRKWAIKEANQPINLLYLANYIFGKGQNLAVEAFARAYHANSQLNLHFYGGDMGLEKNREYKRRLQYRVKQVGLDQVVFFHGFTNDVEQQIKEADILLNFSESESFSLTCLDALFFGTPLIASDCGGPSELFEHGRSGLLVPNQDIAAMTQAILDLANDLGKQKAFSEAGKLYVRQKFKSENTYLKLGEVYAAIIQVNQL